MQYGADKWSKGYTSSLVPTDSQSLAFARTVRQVQNIVYGAIDATQGLFFPEVTFRICVRTDLGFEILLLMTVLASGAHVEPRELLMLGLVCVHLIPSSLE